MRNKAILRYFVSAVLLLGLSAGCSRHQAGPKKSILFIGNSYTYVNDLPQTLVKLADSGGYEIVTGMSAPGGWTLRQHDTAEPALNKLKERQWDFVVLQEQSVVPAVENSRNNEMYPAVRSLNEKIKQAGASPILYLTWGRRGGMPEFGFSDFNSMQEQLTRGYLGIAQELGLRVAPVGEAWKAALAQRPGLDLWQGDGSHPTMTGTYLAACVFYAAIYAKSPEGLGYRADLPKETAQFLQTIANQTVLTDPKKWNIPIQ